MSGLICCCEPLFPLALVGNTIKNKIVYKRNNDTDLFVEMSPPQSTSKRIIFEMVSDALFAGLPNRFEEDLPNTANHIPSEYKQKIKHTIRNINRVLQENVPCTGLIIAYSLCCLCTFGITLIPLCNAGSNAEVKIREYIDKQNEQVFKNTNYKFELQVRNTNTDFPCSWVEVHIENEA
ncbi:transcription termination/antitermination protein NusA [Acrasis kona]|uniref:Transcription termination/antitermination protein NusA n=1 Tax=Acrasis kona TaxID=1008807 RepID=A0AAW2Z1E5_9EUKA